MTTTEVRPVPSRLGPDDAPFRSVDETLRRRAHSRLLGVQLVKITIHRVLPPLEADDSLEVLFTARYREEDVAPYPMRATVPYELSRKPEVRPGW